jgi:hypothetical protein
MAFNIWLNDCIIGHISCCVAVKSTVAPSEYNSNYFVIAIFVLFVNACTDSDMQTYFSPNDIITNQGRCKSYT